MGDSEGRNCTLGFFFEAGGTHVCLDYGIEVWEVIITNTKLFVSKLN